MEVDESDESRRVAAYKSVVERYFQEKYYISKKFTKN